MTDEQPTPPPLDLDAVAYRARGIRRDFVVYEDKAQIADELEGLVAEVRRLRADLAAARAALKHYADEANWTAPPGHRWDELDKGYYLGEGPGFRVARAALKECDDD